MGLTQILQLLLDRTQVLADVMLRGLRGGVMAKVQKIVNVPINEEELLHFDYHGL